MKQKTFNIGEYCVGGTVRVKILSSGMVNIKICEFKTHKDLYQFHLLTHDVLSVMNRFTTFFYANKIFEWIIDNKAKVLKQNADKNIITNNKEK